MVGIGLKLFNVVVDLSFHIPGRLKLLHQVVLVVYLLIIYFQVLKLKLCRLMDNTEGNIFKTLFQHQP